MCGNVEHRDFSSHEIQLTSIEKLLNTKLLYQMFLLHFDRIQLHHRLATSEAATRLSIQNLVTLCHSVVTKLRDTYHSSQNIMDIRAEQPRQYILALQLGCGCKLCDSRSRVRALCKKLPSPPLFASHA
jgi:hypothetical protein